MSAEPNGKATLGLVIQVTFGVCTIIAAVATPLILMYSKINTLEVQFGERLQEIETQFKAADDFRNINLAQQSRVNYLLWQQSFGAQFPPEVYYPSIAKPR